MGRQAGINGSNGPDITVRDGIGGVTELSEVVEFMGEADKEIGNRLIPIAVKAKSTDLTFKYGAVSTGGHSTLH